MEIANGVGADVVIYGTVTGTVSEGKAEGLGTTVFLAQVMPAITVTAADSSEALSEYAEVVTANSLASTDDAMRKAMELTRTKAISAVRSGFFEAWNKQATGVRSITLNVTGLKDYPAFTALRDVLRSSVPSVKDVSSAKFDKVSTMELAAVAPVETLAGELQDKTGKWGRINVTRTNNNSLDLSITPK
ncbi:MAG: hypothetical protein HY901_21505 [Deltaproteobacteria bacterium]|nr:hypothetical protein [Deltaproteobacteria bacterium]